MSTARFTGYFYELTPSGDFSFAQVEMTWSVIGDTGYFRYAIPVVKGPLSPAYIDWDAFHDVSFDGIETEHLGDLQSHETFLGRYTWSDHGVLRSSDVLDITLNASSGFVFSLDGVMLPNLSLFGEMFLDSVTDYDLISFGDLIPDGKVDIEDLSGARLLSAEYLEGDATGNYWDLGDGADLARGKQGDDVFLGGEGADRLHGNTGNDTLNGGAGEDRLRGGAGADQIIGGRDDDLMRGGSGADLFIFYEGDAQGQDRIKDFAVGEDKIQFDGFGAVEDLQIQDHLRGTLVRLDAERILLVGTDATTVSIDDFVFV